MAAEGAQPAPVNKTYKNIFPDKIFLNIDNGLITLMAKNSPLGPVLDEISRQSGIEIKISRQLRSKKVTIEWKGVPLEEGIKKIAGSSGLVYRMDESGSYYLSEVHVVPSSVEKLKNKQGREKASFHETIDLKDSNRTFLTRISKNSFPIKISG